MAQVLSILFENLVWRKHWDYVNCKLTVMFCFLCICVYMLWVHSGHLYCKVKYLDTLTVQMLSCICCRERLYIERFVLYIYWTRQYIPNWWNVFYLWNKNTVTPNLTASFEVQLRFKLKWNDWAWKRVLNLKHTFLRFVHAKNGISPYNHTAFTGTYIKYFPKVQSPEKCRLPWTGIFCLEVFMVCSFRKQTVLDY